MTGSIRSRALSLVLAIIFFPFAGLSAQQSSSSAAAPTAKPANSTKAAVTPSLGFRVEGSSYIAVAKAEASGESEAEEKAKSGAIRTLITGLGKDRLFAEIFVKNPPVGLSFTTLSNEKGLGGDYSAVVSLKVDDESIRILARGAYLSSATSLLDDAEESAAAAEALLPKATEAETAGLLGEALGRYGQVMDRCSAALALIDSVSDATVLSSKGGRGAADLRRSFQALNDTAGKGLARVRQAEKALASDEAAIAVSAVIDSALAEVAKAEALLTENKAVVSDISVYGPERLEPVRDSFAIGKRAMSDARSALDRAQAGLPKEKTYIRDKVDFARRRVATVEASLGKAFAIVDREIRDPTARRAERAQAYRWIFLHEPLEYLQLRVWPPFALSLGNVPSGESRFSVTDIFDFRVRAEGAFGESGGVWARTSFQKNDLPLAAHGTNQPIELSMTQSFDFGFYGKTLWYAGYGWDWIRSVGNEDVDNRNEIRLGFGGVGKRPSGDRRADWLVGLSYELPLAYQTQSGDAYNTLLWNEINLGIDAFFRLGTVAVIEGGIAARSRASDSGLLNPDAVLALRAGLGFRLPKPFLWGAEFSLFKAWPIDTEGTVDFSTPSGVEKLRFFLEYTI